MKKALNWFVMEESGQGLVEYGLIIALIAVLLIGVLSALGGGLGDIFHKVTGDLNDAKDAEYTPGS
ncbi:MAG TPA: Flp family type IVb pilin [Clostridia bacterium]|nr:Flp family type IVb pilin [Clostridia bacterium]